MLADNIVQFEGYKENSKRKLSDEKAQKIIEECKKNLGRWYDYWGDNISKFRSDKAFYLGNQWDEYSAQEYMFEGKVPYVGNLIKPIVRQLVGEQVNMEPSLTLSPTDKEHADASNTILISNFLRHLSYSNHATQAYSTAFLNQCTGGYGVVSVCTDYENEYAFEQKIIIKAHQDPTNVFFDALAKQKSKIDGECCGVFEVMNEDDFKATYPGAKITTGMSLLGSQRTILPHVDSKSVVVVDYYKKHYKNKTLVQLTNNSNFKIEVLKEDVEETIAQYEQMMAMQGISLLEIPQLVESNRRQTKIVEIHCYKLTGEEVIDHYKWPSKYLPFVFFDALSTYTDGKQITESFIHAAIDVQRTYNYCFSEGVNALARSRRETVWMTPEQAKGFEEIHRNPGRQQGYIPYNYDPLAPSGPIFRSPQEISQSFFILANQAKEDLQRILGVYAANRGELPNQTSGVAIGRTITQANLSLVQLLQNLYDGMQSVGEIILDLVPKIYDTERMVSIVDETGKQEPAVINQVTQQGVKNDMTRTAYKLEVKPVASFAIQKQFISDSLNKLASLSPAIAPLVADLIGSQIESPIAPRLVERLQTLVPPQILAKEKGMPPPPPQPSPQDELAQLQMKQLMIEMQNSIKKLQQEQQKINQQAMKQKQDFTVEMGRQALERDEMLIKSAEIEVRADAELQKAQMDSTADVLKALAILKNAQSDIERRH